MPDVEIKTPPAHIHCLEMLENRVDLSNKHGDDDRVVDLNFMNYWRNTFCKFQKLPDGFLPGCRQKLEELRARAKKEEIRKCVEDCLEHLTRHERMMAAKP